MKKYRIWGWLKESDTEIIEAKSNQEALSIATPKYGKGARISPIE